MCRLKIKIKLAGTTNLRFKKLIIIPRNYFIKSKFNGKLGIIDSRKSIHTKYVVVNIKYLFEQYKFGLTPNKKSLNTLYYFFIKNQYLNSYYSPSDLKLFLENEIKQKFNKK